MTKQKKFDFEVAMTELEQIVTQLEGENESLEKSLTLFESGIKLTEKLRSHLDEAEQRIRILTADATGEPQTDDSKV